MWIGEVRQHCEVPDLKVFLVGTKSDLYHDVTEAEAEQVARELGAEYFEVSAKNNHNVRELFDRVTFLTFEQELHKWHASYGPGRSSEESKQDNNDIIIQDISVDPSRTGQSGRSSGCCVRGGR